MKIAIVHDYLNQFGGAERVVSALHEIWPEAPIYTSIYAENKMPEIFRRMDIRVSFMQWLPWVHNLHRFYLFFYPLAFESLDLGGYEVILSSSSAWGKGVKKKTGQLHICYCYTPMRFIWRYDDYVKKEPIPQYLKEWLRFALEPIRAWDLHSAEGVDYYAAISKTVADRIRKTYKRESVIIYPPVETGMFKPSNLDYDYFLVLSRLNAYKRVDIAVDAFNELGLPLKVIGDGPERKNLQRKSGRNIEFLGRVDDRELAKYLAECRALIFPGEEDFGIVPLEAMASGRPVIAYRGGGAEETVMDGETGLFFSEQDPRVLVRAINKFQFMLFDKQRIRSHAEEFDKEVFKRKVKEFVVQKFEEYKKVRSV